MPTVVGREAELERLEAFLSGDARGSLAVVGAPGIGKTTVWEQAVALAEKGGATVLVARPAESEAKLAFGGLADLLADVPDSVFAELPPPQRSALDAALLRAPASGAGGQRLVGTAFLSVVRALARKGRVVLAVDDVHWLDRPSTAALHFAARRLRDEPVRLILSLRAGESARLELPHERIELAPLSVAALHGVLADALGRTFARPVIVRIAEASGGNPLYALEIAREVDRRADGAGPSGVPIPTDFDELVRGRLHKLPDETRSALLRAAGLARPDTIAVDPDALAPAEEAGLVDVDQEGRIHFRHPLYASAVYSATPHARRREMHRALSELVADPVERARHLALGADAGDEDVLAHLDAARREARARGAPDTAAELTELALRLVPPQSERAHELTLELAEHLFYASDLERSRRLVEDLRDVVEGDLLARTLVVLSDIEYWRIGESAGLAIGEQALAAAVDPALRARCQTVIAMYAGTVDVPRAAAAARAAIELLELQPQAEPALLAAALGARVRADLFLNAGFDTGAAQRALELEADAPPAIVDARVVFKLGQWLRYVDDFDGARAQLEASEEQARDEGDDSSLANILLNKLIVETWAGNWREAAELGDRMIVAFQQHGVVSGDLELWRVYVDAHYGRLDAVRTAVARASRREPIVSAVWNRSLGLAELAAGEAADAYTHLADAMELLDSVDFREPAVWRIDGDAIEAALEGGAPEQAERWLERFRARAERSPIPWNLAVVARCDGLVRAARGDLEGAADALERAVTEHESCPMPFERARTLLVQGQILRRLKQKREAREALEAARAIFAELETEPWIARTDAELARVRTRRAPDELSATERAIAELAADGLSNAEIASRVFVSRKTVEANLGRVYRKLGIASRAQLHAALNR